MENCKIVAINGGLVVRGTLMNKNKEWSLNLETYRIDTVNSTLKLMQNCVQSLNIAHTHALAFVSECSGVTKNELMMVEHAPSSQKAKAIHTCKFIDSVRGEASIQSMNLCQEVDAKFGKSYFTHIENAIGIVTSTEFHVADINGITMKATHSIEVPERSSIIWESCSVAWKEENSLKSSIKFILLQKSINIKVKQLFGLVVQTKLSNTSVKPFDFTLLIPKLYCSVTAAICVNVRNKYSLQSSEWSSYFENSVIVLGTTKGQLVKFCNGKLTNLCQLPLQDVKSISSMINSFGEELLFVYSPLNQLCVYNEKLEMVSQLHDVEEYFVEDFLSCGSQQLITLQHVTSKVLHFNLNDFAVYCITSVNQKDDCKSTENDTQSLDMVSKALTKRLQNSVGELHDAEAISQRRETLIQSTMDNIKAMSADREPFHSVTKLAGLVPLVGETHSPIEHRGQPETGRVKVGEIWQRTVGSKWVTGLTVCNKDVRSMKNVTLSLIPDDPSGSTCTLSSSTRSYHSHATPSQDLFEEPPHKKLHLFLCEDENDSELDGYSSKQLETIPSGTTADVLVSSELPVFSQSTEKASFVSLCWCFCSCSPGAAACDGLCSDIHTGSHCVQSAGRVAITAADIISRRHEVALSIQPQSISGLHIRRNLLSLNAVQETTNLKLTSTYSTLSHLCKVLDAQLSCRFQVPYKQYIVTEHGPLHIVRVNVVTSSEYTAQLAVFTVDRAQLFLFIHSLYEALPDDVAIETDSHTQTDKSIRDALSAMSQEISASKRAMKSIVQRQEERLKSCFQLPSAKLDQDEKDKAQGNRGQQVGPEDVFCGIELEHFVKDKLVLETKTNHSVGKVAKLV